MSLYIPKCAALKYFPIIQLLMLSTVAELLQWKRKYKIEKHRNGKRLQHESGVEKKVNVRDDVIELSEEETGF